MVARRSARTAAKAAMTIRPRPARSARISMTPSVAARTRTETAIAEKNSNAPLIQRTTRTMLLGATRGSFRGVSAQQCIRGGGLGRGSLRVGLLLRSRLLKGGKFGACCIDRDDFGESVERHLQTPR